MLSGSRGEITTSKSSRKPEAAGPGAFPLSPRTHTHMHPHSCTHPTNDMMHTCTPHKYTCTNHAYTHMHTPANHSSHMHPGTHTCTDIPSQIPHTRACDHSHMHSSTYKCTHGTRATHVHSHTPCTCQQVPHPGGEDTEGEKGRGGLFLCPPPRVFCLEEGPEQWPQPRDEPSAKQWGGEGGEAREPGRPPGPT